jgi:hypothetical protein
MRKLLVLVGLAAVIAVVRERRIRALEAELDPDGTS